MVATVSVPTLPSPRLFVREAGQGAPMVLLHGLASSSRYWEPHVPHLGQSYRLVAPDLLGFGRSPKPDGAGYAPAEHLAALAEAALSRLDAPATIVGHSMGAVLALHIAAAFPDLVERLVLVSLPVLGTRPLGHRPGGAHRHVHRFAVHSRAGHALFSAGMCVVRPAWPAFYPRLRPDLPRGAAQDALLMDWPAFWRSLEAVVYGTDVPGLFAAAPGPLLVIHGPGDLVAPVGPVRELVRTRPDARYVEIEGAGHNPCFTHAAAFYAALGDGRLEIRD